MKKNMGKRIISVVNSVTAYTPWEIDWGVFMISCPSINTNGGTWRTNSLVAVT